MKSSLIFQSVVKFIFYVLILFSVYLLLRGHNAPGGGFVGGLSLASAYILKFFAFGKKELPRVLTENLFFIMGFGLLLAFLSALIPFFSGYPFMKAMWVHILYGKLIDLHLGTPVLFDVGVYLVVFSVVFSCVYNLINFGEEAA